LVNEFICDILERNIGGFVANMPALWILFRRGNSNQGSSSRYGTNQSLKLDSKEWPVSAYRGGHLKRMDDDLSQAASMEPMNSTVVTGNGHPNLEDGIPMTATRDRDHLRIEVEQDFAIDHSTPMK
jgi:hypothetical protein